MVVKLKARERIIVIPDRHHLDGPTNAETLTPK
jgi:hypothetical protein